MNAPLDKPVFLAHNGSALKPAHNAFCFQQFSQEGEPVSPPLKKEASMAEALSNNEDVASEGPSVASEGQPVTFQQQRDTDEECFVAFEEQPVASAAQPVDFAAQPVDVQPVADEAPKDIAEGYSVAFEKQLAAFEKQLAAFEAQRDTAEGYWVASDKLEAAFEEQPVAAQSLPVAFEEQPPLAKPLFLFIEQGPAEGQAFQIVQGSCTIGRASIVDLCLEHPSVSRRHAQLKRSGDHLYVRDLGSQNGTYVNQQRIINEAEVFAGDSVIIGTSLLRFKDALLAENEAENEIQQLVKPAKSRKIPYYTILIASLAASLTTLVTMMVLKLALQSPAAPPLGEASLERPQPVAPADLPPLLVLHPPGSASLQNPPRDASLSAPLLPEKSASSPAREAASENLAPVLKTFQKGSVEMALKQAQATQQTALAKQLSAFMFKWKTAGQLWKETSKKKPSHVRKTLAAHEEALLAANHLTANSYYAQELKTRIAKLKHLHKNASSSRSAKTSARVSSSPSSSSSQQPPSVSPKELQEKRRSIDEAFDF